MTNIKLTGNLTWTQFRDVIIQKLEDAKTEKQLLDVVVSLIASYGTLNEINKRRKKLGLTPLIEKEIK